MDTESFRRLLQSLLREPPKRDEPMRNHTTLRVGGPADLFINVHTVEELATALRAAREHEVPVTILGQGSNLIVRDGGIRGLVIHLCGEMTRIEFDTTEVRVGAGVYLPYLLKKTALRGLSGLECCAGVPGTVGGALISNAGTVDQFIGDRVDRVTVLTRDGERWTLDRSQLQFGYRWSSLQNFPGVITEVWLRLEVADPPRILQTIRDRLRYRTATQPVHIPCAGCIFKNPPGLRAGALIEQCGLKGYRIGDAEVSPQHANFIVNRGSATAKDVLELSELMRQRVHQSFGVHLEYEVQIIGEPDEGIVREGLPVI
ncbi:MAG: UDP-N-acetylmuramate dehydrogenase [Armatimonadetes bacterium]|nr:UDP-N-acetylmuramate dehydrogenase [Armatimonadota bacterium]MDW8123062.1 UDP-N-acetylmuramate dehydrogenase [Armatimonadota bacterium]